MRNNTIFGYKIDSPTPSYAGLILLLCLSSCASPTLKTPSVTTSSQIGASNCEPPTQYAHRALLWSDSARTEELERLAEVLDSSEGHCAVLELAIFLSTPSNSFQDDRKALLLLEKLDKEEHLSKSEHEYISLFLPHIEQRQNIRQAIDALQEEIQRLSNTAN